jgi:hypothetical protein
MGTRTRALMGIGAVALVVVLGITVKYATRTRHPDTVVVPGVRGGGFPFAFERLRSSGLRVAIPSTLHFTATSGNPSVSKQTPVAGTRVPWGSVVTLRPPTFGGPIGSPDGPARLPVYRVPDFGGRPLAEAVAWTHGKVVYWASDLPPLPPSSAKHLFDAYRVTSQRPSAGSDVRLWTRVRVQGHAGVRLTPLTLEVSPD